MIGFVVLVAVSLCTESPYVARTCFSSFSLVLFFLLRASGREDGAGSFAHVVNAPSLCFRRFFKWLLERCGPCGLHLQPGLRFVEWCRSAVLDGSSKWRMVMPLSRYVNVDMCLKDEGDIAGKCHHVYSPL